MHGNIIVMEYCSNWPWSITAEYKCNVYICGFQNNDGTTPTHPQNYYKSWNDICSHHGFKQIFPISCEIIHVYKLTLESHVILYVFWLA